MKSHPLAGALIALSLALASVLPAAPAAPLAGARAYVDQPVEAPVDFLAGAKLADQLADVPGPEAALWRVRVLARALRGVDYENREQAPMKAWLARHEDEVIFSEPSGESYVARRKIWDLYETAKATPFAEELAWEAAKTPAGGECEGYLPCSLGDSLDSIGRYLELYPKGKYSAAALEELFWFREEPSGVDPLDPADVPEAKRQLERWRKILAAVAGGQDYRKGLDRLAAAYQVR